MVDASSYLHWRQNREAQKSWSDLDEFGLRIELVGMGMDALL